MENQEKSIPLVDHFIERFTMEELYLAKSADLCAVAANLGYTVKKIGQYHTIKEMDSIRIYNRTNWFRWSRQYEKGSNGGSQIDFLMTFAGMENPLSVMWLEMIKIMVLMCGMKTAGCLWCLRQQLT